MTKTNSINSNKTKSLRTQGSSNIKKQVNKNKKFVKKNVNSSTKSKSHNNSKSYNKEFTKDKKSSNLNIKSTDSSNKDEGFKSQFRKNNKSFSSNKSGNFSKSVSGQIESNNPILLHLESLFSILYKNSYQTNKILRELKLNKGYAKNLDIILDLFSKYNIINLAGKKFRFNSRYIKDTKIPRYFLLKISEQNKLGEWLATFPNFINGTEKYTIVLEKTPFTLQNNSYILAKLSKANNNILKASVLTVFPNFKPDIINGLVYFMNKAPYLIPLGRKHKLNFAIQNSSEFTLNEHSLVQVEITNNSSFSPEAKVIKVLNNKDLTNELSLLTAYEFNLPIDFTEEVLQEASSKSGLPDTKNYKDLRDLPLVTIDGEDAKDFDDAVFVKLVSETPLKYRAIVAIADVSSYVTSGSPLDKEAKDRANSTYLPGLVLPMLPHILSNTWCSLNPHEDRATLVADLVINDEGLIESYDFYKAIINSKARLTYNEVEAAINGTLNEKTKPLLDNVIMPLYNCWQILNKAKIKRNALEITANEYKVIFNNDNTINSIVRRKELISNKIIEELMIAANVASAKFLKKHALEQFSIFRIHDKPNEIKQEHFTEVLAALGIKVKIPSNINGQFFNNLLKKYKNTDIANVLNESVLSAQSQAKYSTINIGHFGLALKEYCHFTSPIRRYADLIIHRLISSVLNKEALSLNKNDVEETANYISTKERNSSSAEYSAIEKIIAKLLSNQIDSEFNATVVNITNAGLFVALDEMGAQGLVPMRTLGSERFIFSKERDKLIGINTKTSYKVGQSLQVILKEANPLKGLLTFIIK